MDCVNEISDQEEVKVLNDKINDLRIEYENLYQEEMNKLTNKNPNELEYLKSEFFEFKNRLKNKEVEMKFLLKKQENATEEQKQKLEEMRVECSKSEERMKKVLENIKNTNAQEKAKFESELSV